MRATSRRVKGSFTCCLFGGAGLRTAAALFLSFNLVFGTILTSAPSWAVNFAAPASLKTIPVPEPNNLGLFLKSDPNNLNADGFPIVTPEAKQAAVRLGKALFWDMQVGSDGIQACATCHFHAGADGRTKNQISPSLLGGDNTFSLLGPNGELTPAHFPTTKFLNPDDRFSQMLYDTNDVVSSQGVFKTDYVGQPLKAGSATEQGTIAPDAVFNVGGINTRRVEPRNTPTVINAVFNFANFWDGRANFIFNGVNPFGDADPDAGVWFNNNGALEKQRVSIPNASLASQAVGPPTSDFEMSFRFRTFAQIGKKMLRLLPLAKQKVHKEDGVLGPLAKSPGKGLNTNYAALIQAAFQDKWWNNNSQIIKFSVIPEYLHLPDSYDPSTYYYENGVPTVLPRPIGALQDDEFSQMEANFSLFFGLAVQLYESTLVSDDAPFDRFQEGDAAAMSPSAQSGLNIFLAANEPLQLGGSCIGCHGTETFSNASVMHVGATNFGASLPEGLMERMIMGDFGGAWYDAGYYDIGIRPIEDDQGRGGADPFAFPFSFTERALLVFNGNPPPFETPPLPCGPGFQLVCPQDQRVATPGSFKTPALRNVELTGPYMHNGGQATLAQVMDFYTRGGDFHERNLATLDPEINVLFGLVGNDAAHIQVIDFMLALTDERVRWERAPFDHPELLVPNGAPGDTQKVKGKDGQAKDKMLRIQAVGAAGAKKPLSTFLNLDPHDPVW